jgi:serine/threonine-protein kinase
LIRQALDPLIEAHDLGIVHRDLKPENLFLCCGAGGSAPQVKVLDFGIARAMGNRLGESLRDRLTMQGGVCGTPHYMAPELVKTGELSPAADIYALGCIAHEMLSGTPPFDAETSLQLMIFHCEQPPPLLPVEVKPGLRRAIARAMAKDPLERPLDARAFAQTLDEIECDTDEWPIARLAHSQHRLRDETLQRVTPPHVPPATVDPDDPNCRRTIRTRNTDTREANTKVIKNVPSLSND